MFDLSAHRLSAIAGSETVAIVAQQHLGDAVQLLALTSHPEQYAALVSRRVVIAMAVVLTLVLVAARGWGNDRPDYKSASAIAVAPNDHGIACTFAPMPPAISVPSLVESSGECRRVDFHIYLFVFRDSDARKEGQREAAAYWCGEGTVKGSYVAAGRWLVSMDVSSTNDWLYMNDIADATDGERFPQTCG